MPAIGRRSTKPLNDPPRRSGATATLFQSRKSSAPLAPSPTRRPGPRADFRCEITLFFDINRPADRIARTLTQSSLSSVAFPRIGHIDFPNSLWKPDECNVSYLHESVIVQCSINVSLQSISFYNDCNRVCLFTLDVSSAALAYSRRQRIRNS